MDDTILLGGSSQIIAHWFKNEMNRYCQASGSKINFRKSQIYGWNINPKEMLEITWVLDMDRAVNWDSFNYLGLPIFKSNSKTSAWLLIVEKVKKKIMGWGAV